MNIRVLKKGDIILILCILMIAGLIFIMNNFASAANNNNLIAEVVREGNLIKIIDLNKVKNPEYVIFDEGIKQVILVEKGRIRFLESDCRDKFCVKGGWLTKTGAKAVCIPAKTIVTIVGDQKQTDSNTF
ncbi:MAG: NusG domain II-containing protein [Desulfitobacteriaceae bacterium]|nr:NusG domain II-containing protein [Desulfitobacteriaceae bacterium]MDD4345975.1 NusG domain II-containing protein [Desulfitobacteriaceae bacterium]MDD4401006.1 NusG domain II-containing protein [Desulfitobacteriaceae bacterium]